FGHKAVRVRTPELRMTFQRAPKLPACGHHVPTSKLLVATTFVLQGLRVIRVTMPQVERNTSRRRQRRGRPYPADSRRVTARLAAGHSESADRRLCVRFSGAFPKYGNRPSTLRTHVPCPRGGRASQIAAIPHKGEFGEVRKG